MVDNTGVSFSFLKQERNIYFDHVEKVISKE